MLFETCIPHFWSETALTLSIFNFCFDFLLSLSTLEFSQLLERDEGFPRLIQGGSKPQIKNILTGEVFRRAGTAAYKFQNSDSEDSAQLKSKFLYFQLRLLASKLFPGEGRDDLHLALYPFCQILSFSIYCI